MEAFTNSLCGKVPYQPETETGVNLPIHGPRTKTYPCSWPRAVGAILVGALAQAAAEFSVLFHGYRMENAWSGETSQRQGRRIFLPEEVLPPCLQELARV